MKVPGDPRNTYVARMEWADDNHLVLQHLNRLQNTNDVLLSDATTGDVVPIHQDRNDAWVEVVQRMDFTANGEELVWLSEKDGYRHAYAVARDGGHERLLTRFEDDVIQPLGLDSAGEWFYFIASPESATERYLFRSSLEGDAPPERLTPRNATGTHAYDLSPNGRWAFHTFSSFDAPPRVDLVQLPDHTVMRTLEDNAALQAALDGVLDPPVSMFEIEIEPGVTLDSWMLKPANFDARKKYPLLVLCLRRACWANRPQSVVRRAFFVPSRARQCRLHRGELRQSRDAGAQRRAVARDRLRDRRRSLVERPGRCGHSAREGAFLYRRGPCRHLGVERRRVEHVERDVPLPRYLPCGRLRGPGARSNALRYDLSGTLHGLAARERGGYRVGSPINFAEGLEGKLLLIHGTGDDNVHYQGTERLVNRLVELGKPFDLMVYPNRSHAIKEGDGTTLHIYNLITRYLLQTGWVASTN